MLVAAVLGEGEGWPGEESSGADRRCGGRPRSFPLPPRRGTRSPSAASPSSQESLGLSHLLSPSLSPGGGVFVRNSPPFPPKKACQPCADTLLSQSAAMKVVNLKQAILQAWKERWSDYQWAINMKRFFPRGATWDILNLAGPGGLGAWGSHGGWQWLGRQSRSAGLGWMGLSVLGLLALVLPRVVPLLGPEMDPWLSWPKA